MPADKFRPTHIITAFDNGKPHIYKVELQPTGEAREKNGVPSWDHGSGAWVGPKSFDLITVKETGNYANSPARVALREQGRLAGIEKSKYYNEHYQAQAMRKGKKEREQRF